MNQGNKRDVFMKKCLRAAAALCLGGCVYGTPVNNEGFYSNADITKVDWSRVDGKGSSCQTNWLFGLIPAGDNSLASAVARGDIAKIAYVDTDWVLYLPLLMSRDCTNVYGELTPIARTALSYRNAERNKTVSPNPASSISSVSAAPASMTSASATPSATPSAKAASKSATSTKPGSVSESVSDYDFPAQ